MATQQIEQARVSRQLTIGNGLVLAGLTLALLVVIALLLQRSVPAQPAVATLAQPVVGRSIIVTGLVFDGTRYRSVPVAIATGAEQPVVGHAVTITGAIFDGMRYRNKPITIGALRAESGYSVTAYVWDGARYRTAPAQASGH
jgi:hypothetical protein